MKKEKMSIFKAVLEELKNILKHPINLLPSFILTIFWIIFPILSAYGKNTPFLRFLYTLFYANGGMFKGFFGAVGGIIGKAIFASILNIFIISLFNKKNPFKGIKNNFKNITFSGFISIVPLIIGTGLAFIFYIIFNMSSSTQNIMISLILALGMIKAFSNQNGIIFSITFNILNKITKGKSPSYIEISKFILGLTLGFTICFPLTFIRLPLLIFLLGVFLVIIGVLLKVLKLKKAVAAILVLLFILPLISYSNSIKNSVKMVYAEEYTEGTDLTPYKGRLTYHNGRKNKYGQPFPDLMDFDKDGAITWFDYDIQRELSHDPDYLYRPLHEGVTVFIAILSSFIGVTTGIAGAILSNVMISGSESFTEESKEKKEDSKYINVDEDGDLNVVDPVTRSTVLYKSNGDGTYTNPLTDATYTKEELNDLVNSRIENIDLLNEDEKVKNEAIETQREKNGELSELTKTLEEEKHKEIRIEEENRLHDEYVDSLKYKYNKENIDDLRNKISSEQQKAEIESYEQLEYEKEYEKSQKYAENTKAVADTAIDVLSEIEPTGAGKAIKDEYTVLSSVASNMGEVMAGDKTLAGGLAQSVVDSAVGLAKNHAGDLDLTGTGGLAEKAIANISGDGIQATSNELMKGKSLDEALKKGSSAAIDGGKNFVIDSVFDVAGGNLGSKSDDALGSVLGSEITKNGATEGAKALGSDITKNATNND